MGLTWPDGKSLLKPDRREHHLASADNDPSFTLGADNLSPIDVAASDATLPARGIYCSPVAITKIVTDTGQNLPVESAHCHRALSQSVADAANYILQGDLTSGTAIPDSIGRPAASKTGTADSYVSAFFVGYTPQLLGAVWVGNPRGNIDMIGPNSCYRLGCVGSMYGSMAPGHTWQITFLARAAGHAPRRTSWRCRPPVPCSPWARPRPADAADAAEASGGGGGGPRWWRRPWRWWRRRRWWRWWPQRQLGRASLPPAGGPPVLMGRRRRLTAEPAADLGGDPSPLGPPGHPRGEGLHDLAHGARAARSGLLDRGRHQVG